MSIAEAILESRTHGQPLPKHAIIELKFNDEAI
ncbi:hypothetical protein ANO14919_070070 [Xylariales sp. No.14919]|nr:hypothetical protein ANO14919_070070 [Xylariales sp. No.14919]